MEAPTVYERNATFKSDLIVAKETPADYNKHESNTEEPSMITKHDLIFKQLISNFFEEFLDASFSRSTPVC